jgi:hypothetical protein
MNWRTTQFAQEILSLDHKNIRQSQRLCDVSLMQKNPMIPSPSFVEGCMGRVN